MTFYSKDWLKRQQYLLPKSAQAHQDRLVSCYSLDPVEGMSYPIGNHNQVLNVFRYRKPHAMAWRQPQIATWEPSAPKRLRSVAVSFPPDPWGAGYKGLIVGATLLCFNRSYGHSLSKTRIETPTPLGDKCSDGFWGGAMMSVTVGQWDTITYYYQYLITTKTNHSLGNYYWGCMFRCYQDHSLNRPVSEWCDHGKNTVPRRS